MIFILFCFQPLCSCQQYSIFFFFLVKIFGKYHVLKALFTCHLQNKLVHINCIFHSKWVADFITWNVQAFKRGCKNQKWSWPVPRWRHICILEDFWKAAPSLPLEPQREQDLGCLAWPVYARVGLRGSLPCFLEAKSLGAVSLLGTPGPWSTEVLFSFYRGNSCRIGVDFILQGTETKCVIGRAPLGRQVLI